MITNNNILNRQELSILFQKFINGSKGLIKNISHDSSYKGFDDYEVCFSDSCYLLSVNIRNISNAYLPHDPSILRRQVGPLVSNEMPQNTKKHLIILGGFTLLDEKPIFAVWNPFNFCDHKKARSCYIKPLVLKEAASNGMSASEYSSIAVYACDENNLENLITRYINENATDR